jgi:transposase
MAYSEDFRKRALEYLDNGHTYKELYEAFKIYPSEIAKWRKLLSETGALKPQYPKTRPRKIDKTELEKALEEKPDLYLSELGKKFGCSKQAVFCALKRMKITRKKRHLHTPKNPPGSGIGM